MTFIPCTKCTLPFHFLRKIKLNPVHDNVRLPAEELWKWSMYFLSHVYLNHLRIHARIVTDQLDLTDNVNAALLVFFAFCALSVVVITQYDGKKVLS